MCLCISCFCIDRQTSVDIFPLNLSVRKYVLLSGLPIFGIRSLTHVVSFTSEAECEAGDGGVFMCACVRSCD